MRALDSLMPMAERYALAEKLGISVHAVYQRLRRGWVKDAMANAPRRISSPSDLLTYEDMVHAKVLTCCPCVECKAGRATSRPRTPAQRWARTMKEWRGRRGEQFAAKHVMTRRSWITGGIGGQSPVL